MTKKRPGDLVVLRLRWNTWGDWLGVVVAWQEPCWLVMWSSRGSVTQLSWHLDDAVIVVSDMRAKQVKGGKWSHVG